MQLKIPHYFQPFTAGATVVEVDGATVAQVLEDLFRQHPALRTHFFTPWGMLSANVLIYVNEAEISGLQGLATTVPVGGRVRIVPAVSGG